MEGLEPRTLYRFRLKVTSPSGEYEYSPVVSVSTTSEYTHAELIYLKVSEDDKRCGGKKILPVARPSWKQTRVHF